MATAAPSFRPLDEEALARLSPADRLAYSVAAAVAYERGLIGQESAAVAYLVAPTTDEELLDAVEDLTGHHIPRVAVCEEHGHKSPAQLFCDVYFCRTFNTLWIAARGTGKTSTSGKLHGAKARWNPDYVSIIAGAVAHQSQRAYAEFQRFTRTLDDEIVESLISRTNWLNGSLTEVVGGTMRALNGPHGPFSQFDELELVMAEEVFDEFLNIAQGNHIYESQQLLTSTRKRRAGLVQKLFKESQEEIRRGDEPAWEIYISCCFESVQRQPSCRMAPENADADPATLCQCHKIKSGKWDDGTDRSFDTVCRGRAYRADGFVPIVDLHKRFRTLSRFTWEAQQECLTPDIEGMVHKWVRDEHRLQAWWPYPQLGPVYRGWDWGGQNPHAIVWIQRLTVEVGLAWRPIVGPDGAEIARVLTPVLSDDDDREIVKRLPERSLIQFDEIYGNREKLGEFSSLGYRVVMRQIYWAKHGFPFAVAKDYCDPSGYVGKNEVKKAVKNLREMVGNGTYMEEVLELLSETGLTREDLEEGVIQVPSFQSRPASIRESLGKLIEWGEKGLVYYVPGMCPGTDDEYEAYRWPSKKADRPESENPVDEDNHAMDAKRYVAWNLHRTPQEQHEQPGALEREKPTEKAKGAFAPIPAAPDEAALPDGSPVGVAGPYNGGRARAVSKRALAARPGIR